MKKSIIVLLLAVFSVSSLEAQVFNTSSTLKRGQFSAGFEPGLYINGGTDFYLYLFAGAGLTRSVDFGFKLGVLGGDTYVGGDIEFALGKIFSLSAGAHSWGDFGLDGTALFTFPIHSQVSLYTGLDLDVQFHGNDDVDFPAWIPLGVEVKMNRNMVFIFEAEINITDPGAHYLGGGLNFFF